MVAVAHLTGVLVALGAAFASATSSLLVRVGTDEGRAVDGVLVGMTINLVVLVPLVGIVYYPNYGLTGVSWPAFVAAGLSGTMMGRAFSYSSIDRIGASRTVPITASNALVAAVLGVVVLGEHLTAVHSVGIVLVVLGVAALSWETTQENPDRLPARELLVGLLLPFGAALAYGIEPIFASIGLREGTPAPVGLVVKTVAATLGFALYLRLRHSLPTVSSLRRENTKWFVLAGISNTLFLLGYYVALQIAPVSVVVPIIITNTLFVVILSAAIMPQRLERVTWRLVATALVVVAGLFAITVLG